MGGLGSGRRGYHRRRRCLNERTIALVASSVAMGWPVGSRAQADVDCTPPWAERFREFLPMVARAQPRGGVMWLWECPRCDRTVRQLYLVPFATDWGCRICCRLGYATQRMAPTQRYWHKARKLAVRAGASKDDADRFPVTRPKGMHHSTFERLRTQWEEVVCLREQASRSRICRLFPHLKRRLA